jgi:hypothetical protein
MKNRILFVLLTGIIGFTFSAFADHHKMAEPTKEMRAKMAATHAEVAECFKSDKPASVCQKVMMDHHKEMC